MSASLEIVVGRIERLAVDAVVNAANRALARGSGVDGALRAAAGPGLDALLATYRGLAEGQALVTPGFDLPARLVIHTVAPIYFAAGDEAEKIALLGACYRACVEAAQQAGCASLGFPALGTGTFGWPKPLGCEIAVANVKAASPRAPSLSRIIFCCFTEEDAALYRAALG
jgi:O-acetyl-ADP-ribose deacetylase (regulator of RNase III)